MEDPVMKHVVLLRPGPSGVSEDVAMVTLQAESSEGPLEFQFAASQARDWTAAFGAAEALLSKERIKRDMTVQAGGIRKVTGVAFAADYRGQSALVRAQLADGTSAELAIPRAEMQAIVEFFQKTEGEFTADDALRKR
jgi:hypothetical protein